MRIVPGCEKCLYDRQIKLALSIEDEKVRECFLTEIRETLEHRDEEDTAPYIAALFRRIYEKYMGRQFFPAKIKRQYNGLVLSLEEELEARIEAAADPLARALVYARIGNYIDFGAMHQVEPEKFFSLLEEEAEVPLPKEVYDCFCRECGEGENFLLLCDNCGEIVLDKLFVRQLKKRFPHLKVTAMVRGQEVLNDATMEDALESGLTREARVVTNGCDVAGTVWKLLSPQARRALETADVILSKGQGNYESLYGYHGPVYYSFLCKCDLFVSKFRVPRFTGMFVRELR